MFEALIVICMSTEQKDRPVIEDTRGPYTTGWILPRMTIQLRRLFMRLVSLTILFFFSLVMGAQADFSWVGSAKWSNELGYTKCGFFGSCKIYQDVKVNTRSASVGDSIRILDRGKEVDEFIIKGIAYDAREKKCWITKKSGESDTYLTVSGCRPK